MPAAGFVKQDASAPAGFFEAEAAGLAWLAEAPGGVRAARVLDVQPGRIAVEQVAQVPATSAAAEDLGRRLATTHGAGARWYGAPPTGWDADGFIGPLPLPHATTEQPAGFGAFYAAYRLEPFVRAAEHLVDAADRSLLRRVVDRAAQGTWDGDPEPPSRLHGDLWAGNVLWSPSGAVLIDPAAHGGHRETDLAMLALFGLPHLDRVVAAYEEVAPLADGWRDRIGLHQLHPLLVHAVLFGGGYARQAVQVARRYG